MIKVFTYNRGVDGNQVVTIIETDRFGDVVNSITVPPGEIMGFLSASAELHEKLIQSRNENSNPRSPSFVLE